jgi:HD-GYP domain-containing protein (c-di-GMP phosphodiesterase class II)
MSEPPLSTAVNQHYLDKVMDLTETMEVHASEDIFDARGNKLLAKGARVSRALQERLIVHKLTKPLEACIAVDGGVDNNAVFESGQRILDAGGALAQILAGCRGTGPSAMVLLSSLKFGNAMGMMLTIANRNEGKALDHAVTVSLLAIAIARRAGLSELDQRVAGTGGLLHDVGELYIDPAYLMPGKRLLPHEWAHLVVHPHTGQMLINELDSFPPAVGRAVAEHHERFDGSGYPRRTAGAAISAAGQVVSLAEMVAGVLGRDRPLERTALALKIIPGEHARIILDALAGSLRTPAPPQRAHGAAPPARPVEAIERLVCRMQLAAQRATRLLEQPRAASARSRDLLDATVSRIRNVQRAIVSTGLDIYQNMDAAALADEPALLFEKEVATREMQWRLRDIARDLALQAADPNDRLLFVPIVNVLDDDFSACDYRSEEAPQVEPAAA